MGYDAYTSPGQREAVRAAFLMPEGSTLLINLPTGGGKTVAFQLPSLTWASQAGLTLVVVPTVALAREQEERFRALLGRHRQYIRWATQPLAYYGGLDQGAKRAVRNGIRDGTIPIVFTSPEAALGALRRPLFEAARQARLRYFVLDEAHIVSQWGQNFRPEFQSIAGLRTALLAACPTDLRFRTLLLTATLTPESYRTLRMLFGGDDCQMVSEVSLRPEPGFLLHVATAEHERREKTFEAVRYLPRPLILYTTLREDALAWYRYLTEAGFRRLRLVRGGSLGDSEGEQLLRAWQRRAVDIIVATSAFGLGVDQGDVRSVVHACLPETIDRYYQEVGRGGRDGNGSVALLVTTGEDLKIAKGLSQETIIGVDRAFERWNEMWLRRRLGDDGTHVVSLDARPADIAEFGKWNAAWNLRTLVLMAQAGLMEFAAHLPPGVEQEEDEDDAEFDDRRRDVLNQFYREVAIRVRDARHSDREHWDDVVLRTRVALREADRDNSRMLEELQNLARPMNDIFRGVYTLREPTLVRPPRFLGSCPITRAQATVNFLALDPEVTTLTHTDASITSLLDQALRACRDDAGRCWVAYQLPGHEPRAVRRSHDSIRALLRYVVAHGIVELSLPEGFLSEEEWNRLVEWSPMRFLIRSETGIHIPDPPLPEMPRPRLTMLEEHDCQGDCLARVMRLYRPCHVIVVPFVTIPVPRRPGRRLFDVVRHLDLDVLLARLES